VYDDLSAVMRPKRATIIHGPRRVGKTTLVEQCLDRLGGRTLKVTGDDVRVRNLLAGQDRQAILDWAEGYDTVFVDEAQRIPGVGWALKTLVDARADLKLIATGSASFALANQLGEPLTGRQVPLTLFPLALSELRQVRNASEIRSGLGDLLVYGMYPEVRTAESQRDKELILSELVGSYLYKDILELERVKGAKVLADLLTLVALQIGAEVSLSELAGQVRLDVKTVARYLDLFEKCYILFNLRGLSRNLRNEVTRTSKYFFYDTGVRNAVLNDFHPLDSRQDKGALWENFMVMERIKALTYTGKAGRFYFWRTWDQAEVDLVEDRAGGLHAYEFKINPKMSRRSAKPPQAFARAYPDATYEVVTPDDFIDNLSQLT
jgi:predicted AAA+ superfamily ATPase